MAGLTQFLSVFRTWAPKLWGCKSVNGSDVQSTVRNSLRACVENETDVTAFSFSLKPSKTLQEGGLGLQPQAWHALLDRLKSDYLPQTAPYSELVVDQPLVDSTYDKDLSATAFALTLLLTGGG